MNRPALPLVIGMSGLVRTWRRSSQRSALSRQLGIGIGLGSHG